MVALQDTQTQPVSVHDALRSSTRRLSDTPTSTPRLDAEVILMHVLASTRAHLLAYRMDTLRPESIAMFNDLVEQRARGIPVAYLTGHKEFMGLDFHVGEGVLIPRPDTECIVEWAIDFVNCLPGSSPRHVIDIGTGSGAIGLSVAHAAPRANVVLSDVSADALRFASMNRNSLGLQQSAQIIRGSLLGWYAGQADLIVANLPYLRPDQIDNNWEIQHEPRSALNGGQDGLELIAQLVQDAPRVLRPGGALALEIEPSQYAPAENIALNAFSKPLVSRLSDLTGATRFAVIHSNQE